MDILHLKKKDIEQMSVEERYDALVYSTLTYTVRRVDLPYMDNKKDKENDSKKQRPNTKRYTFQCDLVDDFIARETIKDFQEGKRVPKRSYVPMYRGEVKK